MLRPTFGITDQEKVRNARDNSSNRNSYETMSVEVPSDEAYTDVASETSRKPVEFAKEPPQSKATIIMKAYAAETKVSSVSAMFLVGRTLLIVREQYIFSFDLDTREPCKPVLMKLAFEELATIGFDRVDAAFSRIIEQPDGRQVAAEVFVFRNGRCLRSYIVKDEKTKDRKLQLVAKNKDRKPQLLSKSNGKLRELDWPDVQQISDAWPGIVFDRIDAAMYAGPEHVYFFRDDQYTRFRLPDPNLSGDDPHSLDSANLPKGIVYPGYPKPIRQGWPGITFDRVDSVICLGNEKAYFFREDQFIRYDLAKCFADPGYPKYIPSDYVEDWEFLV